jgi:two-component system chemotaxis response regulator CheB
MGTFRFVVMGASWGGPNALRKLLGALPPELDAAVAVVQHRGPDSEPGSLCRALAPYSALPVSEIEDKDEIERGRVYLAPGNYHVLGEAGSFSLSTDERVQYSRPSIDVLFMSAADSYGDRVIGVLLTGGNEDGAQGLARIRARGGLTIVQDPATAENPVMPRAAIAAGAAQHVLGLPEIAMLVGTACGVRAIGGERHGR